MLSPSVSIAPQNNRSSKLMFLFSRVAERGSISQLQRLQFVLCVRRARLNSNLFHSFPQGTLLSLFRFRNPEYTITTANTEARHRWSSLNLRPPPQPQLRRSSLQGLVRVAGGVSLVGHPPFRQNVNRAHQEEPVRRYEPSARLSPDSQGSRGLRLHHKCSGHPLRFVTGQGKREVPPFPVSDQPMSATLADQTFRPRPERQSFSRSRSSESFGHPSAMPHGFRTSCSSHSGGDTSRRKLQWCPSKEPSDSKDKERGRQTAPDDRTIWRFRVCWAPSRRLTERFSVLTCRFAAKSFSLRSDSAENIS